MKKLSRLEMFLDFIEDEKSIKALMRDQQLEYSEAKVLFFQGEYKKSRLVISHESAFLTACLQRIMGTINTKSFYNYFIICSDDSKHGLFDDGGNSLKVYVGFDFQKYISLHVSQKKQYLFEKLKEGVSLYNDDIWSSNDFKKALNKIQATNYLNEYCFTKRAIYNPSKDIAVKVHINHDIDCFEAILHIFNRKQELILKRPLFRVTPFYPVYAPLLGKVSWLTDTQVALNPVVKGEPIVVKISRGISTSK